MPQSTATIATPTPSERKVMPREEEELHLDTAKPSPHTMPPSHLASTSPNPN
jgi:hypothetical protein